MDKREQYSRVPVTVDDRRGWVWERVQQTLSLETIALPYSSIPLSGVPGLSLMAIEVDAAPFCAAALLRHAS